MPTNNTDLRENIRITVKLRTLFGFLRAIEWVTASLEHMETKQGSLDDAWLFVSFFSNNTFGFVEVRRVLSFDDETKFELLTDNKKDNTHRKQTYQP